MSLSWFKSRFTSISIQRWYPHERKILLALAIMRAVLSVSPCWVFTNWKIASILSILAPLCALFSADFIENRLRKWLLGYSYNPNVSAIGEWEGYNGPTRQEDEAQWRAELWKIRAPWWGEKLEGNE